jgi:hypothetical protein
MRWCLWRRRHCAFVVQRYVPVESGLGRSCNGCLHSWSRCRDSSEQKCVENAMRMRSKQASIHNTCGLCPDVKHSSSPAAHV